MTDDVVITGYGVFTAFGHGDQPLLDGVFEGRSAFRPVTRFDTTRFRTAHAAAHDGSTDVLRQREVFTTCARAALIMADLTDLESVPLLVGTKGDFTGITRFWQAKVAGRQPDDEAVLRSMPAELVREVAADLGCGGRRLAFTNACVAATNAIIHGCRLIRTGQADAVLVGGVYLIDEEVFAKFDSARALAADGQVRPFSKGRQGVLLGDGAGALVLESARHARARSAQPLARVAGWAMAGDAHHVVQPHPEGKGMAAAIQGALRGARIGPDQLGYVNAHGTGTVINDVSETVALHKALGPHAPEIPISSTKSTTGHALEASGALEAVISILVLRGAGLPPTAGYAARDPACDLDYVPNEPREAEPHYALSVNAAFGGVNAALVLERT